MSKKNSIKKSVYKYIGILSEKIPIKQVVLFGSYARGKTNKYSDIDLAIFSPRFSDATHINDLKLLWTEAAKVDSSIEPIPFSYSEIKNADSRSFLGGILKSGKTIWKSA